MAKQLSLTVDDLALIKQELERFVKELISKGDELCKRLAQEGYEVMRATLLSAQYDGTNDTEIDVEKTEGGYKIIAYGQAVLFIEFGSGASMGYGHPMAEQFNMGPSTWSEGESGKHHWDDPQGWIFMDDDGQFHQSFGNPPAQSMIHTQNKIINSIKTIAQEVFG